MNKNFLIKQSISLIIIIINFHDIMNLTNKNKFDE